MTTPIPAVDYPGQGTRLQSDIQTYLNTMLSINMEMLGATGAAATAILSSNTFTPGNNNCLCPIDTNNLPTGTLDTIQSTNLRDGQVIYLQIVNSSHVITIANAAGGAGEIYTADGNNIVLSSTSQWVALVYRASITAFVELFRSIPNWGAPGAIGATTANTGAFSSLTVTTPVGAGSGGTGVNAGSAANGSLLIGNGSGFSLATLTQGSGITITNSSGGITIAANNAGSVTSVGLADSTGLFNVTGSPVTSTGTLTLSSFKNQAANTAFGNFTGSSAAPSFGTVSIGAGGTGQTSAAAAYNALSPMTTLGDIEYESAANTANRLAGNTTTTKKFLSQTGTGSVSAAPGWNTIAAGDVPAITLSASGNGGVAGTLPIASGGTNATTASAAFNNLSPITTTGDLIVGTGTDAAGRLGIGANNTLPMSNGTTLAYGNIASANFGSNTLAVANGGTGAASASAAYNALSPMTTLGDMEYESAANTASRLAGNTTTTKKFLTQTGTGSASAAPGWNTIAGGDVPAITLSASGNGGVTGTLPIANGGTNATTASGGFNNLSPITTTGDLIIGTGTDAAGRLAIGATNTLPISNGTNLGYGNIASANFGSNTLALANGGTGAASASAAYNALSPMTTLGDIEYESGANTASRLPGNTSTTKKFLTQTGTGSASAAPGWNTIAAGDVPAITLSASGNGGVTGTLPIASGGTNATSASVAFNNLSPITVAGDLIIGTGTDAAGRLGIGANNTLPISNGSTLAYGNIASANFGSNTLAIANGGTNASTASVGFNNLSPITTTGDLIIGTGTDTAGRLGIGANNTLPISNGSTLVYGNIASASFGSNILAIANGGTGSSTVTGPAWFGASGSGSGQTPAFNTGTLPDALVNWAAPSAIGSTTPAAGTFTALTAQTDLLLGSSSDTALRRNAAAIVEVDNGTAGLFGDLVVNNATCGILAPQISSITHGGTAGSATYSYVVAAVMADGTLVISSVYSSATGNATLSGTNTNIISWGSTSGAVSYNVYRGQNSQSLTVGLLGNTTATSFTDTGGSVSGIVPSLNTGGVLNTPVINQIGFGTAASSVVSTFGGSYQNQGPLANNPDYYGDWLISGLVLPTLPTSGLALTVNAQSSSASPFGCLLLVASGNRIAIQNGDARLTNTYTASKDTYVDVDYAGNFHYSAVANGATAPAVYTTAFGNDLNVPAMRLAKVVTGASTVTAVTILAQTSAPARGQAICYGRLYGSTGVPYGDVTGTSTLYFGASNAGNQISLMPTAGGASISTFNQMSLQTLALPTVSGIAQVSVSLSGLTAGTPYDIYVYWEIDIGTLVIDTPVAWSGSGTFTPPTRSIGLDGRQYKNGDYSRLWVGSIIAASATTVNNNEGDRGIINVYNRVVLPLFGMDPNNSWTGNSTTYATMDANTTNGQQRVRWLEITGSDAIQLYAQFWVGNNTAGTANIIAINIDSTGTSPNVTSQVAEVTANFVNTLSCQYVFRIVAGLHYAQAMYKVGGGTATFYSIFGAYAGYLEGSILG